LLLAASLLFTTALAGCGAGDDRSSEGKSYEGTVARGATESGISVADALPDELLSPAAVTPAPVTGAATPPSVTPGADAASGGAVTTDGAAAPGSAQGEAQEGGKDGDDKESPKDSGKKGAEESGKKKDSDKRPDKAEKGGERSVKDRYETDPVPPGKPTPAEPQEQDVDTSTTYTCTLYIGCEQILGNMNALDPAKKDIVPKDGVIYAKKRVSFSKGESVFDILKRETRAGNIHMEFVNTPVYNSAYIEGIANIYEFDCGSLSGWMYNVNGWYPNYGCSRYEVQEGDAIEWRYTCDLGRDLGADVTSQM
jgi:hypothetical protein